MRAVVAAWLTIDGTAPAQPSNQRRPIVSNAINYPAPQAILPPSIAGCDPFPFLFPACTYRVTKGETIPIAGDDRPARQKDVRGGNRWTTD
jgi:hypothetical protein